MGNNIKKGRWDPKENKTDAYKIPCKDSKISKIREAKTFPPYANHDRWCSIPPLKTSLQSNTRFYLPLCT